MGSPTAPAHGTRRPRVLTLIDVLSNKGGAERFALRVATSLDPRRFESIMCASRWPVDPRHKLVIAAGPEAVIAAGQEALAELERAGTRFLPLHRRHKVDPGALLRLERFMRRERIDLVHAHKFGSNLWGIPIARLARVPVVVAHEHTWSYEGKPWRRLLDREVIARGADRFVAVSRADRERMSSVEGIDPARTDFIPIGIESSAAGEGTAQVRRELGIAATAPVIVSVGLLRAQKAHGVLVRAVAELTPRWPELRLLLVGDGPERPSLQELIAELGLERSVKLLGIRHDVPQILAEADLAACSSDFEGTPLSVLEYMDAGLPIVATAVGGIPDLIESGVQGLLVPPREPHALAAALGELLEDPEGARRMGERAQRRRREEFELRAVVGRIEDLYAELLARRGIAVPAG